VLFQLASIAEGIDGEIARATHRTSARGASLDSVTDGFTNCGFLLGAGVNLVMRGRAAEGAFGPASPAILTSAFDGAGAALHDRARNTEDC
jgi:CDP-L-myo-inositol myo-inositolphosphotransferase